MPSKVSTMLEVLNEVAKRLDYSFITSEHRRKFNSYHNAYFSRSGDGKNFAVCYEDFFGWHIEAFHPLKWYQPVIGKLGKPSEHKDEQFIKSIAEILHTRKLSFILAKWVACKNLIFLRYEEDYNPTKVYVLDLEVKEARTPTKTDWEVFVSSYGLDIDTVRFSNLLVNAVLNYNANRSDRFGKIRNINDFKTFAGLNGICYPFDDSHLDNSLNFLGVK